MFKPYPVFIVIIFALVGFLIHGFFPAFIYTSSMGLSLVFFTVGIFFIAWAIRFFRVNKTTVMPFETPKQFIKEGPFRYTRNPIYLGMFLMLVGIYVMLGNVANVILLALFVSIMNRLIIVGEEKTLEREFGDKYVEYKASVGRWIF
jgi:protein-S-isoprenylcysteine O-methyltransferase Ste14